MSRDVVWQTSRHPRLACLPLQSLVVSKMSLPVLPKTKTPSAGESTGDLQTKPTTQEQGDVYSEKEVASSVEIDPAVERSALWKVDLVVVPIVGMYCTCWHPPFRCIRGANITVLRFPVVRCRWNLHINITSLICILDICTGSLVSPST